MIEGRQRIAVVGAGIAGILSAHLLSRKHDVTLIEAAPRLGGHTYTVTVPSGPDKGTPVDMGFIVLNDKTYPTLHAFLRELEIVPRLADMSFSVYCKSSGLQYASANMNAVFADRANIVSPRFLSMLFEIRRFWRVGAEALRSPERLVGISMAEFLSANGFSSVLLNEYIIPMGAAIWSSPSQGMADFPAALCLGFFRNHGLLAYFDQPRWQTIPGGSSSYVAAFAKRFKGLVRLAAPVTQILRRPGEQRGVTVRYADSHHEDFDSVVCALHASRVLGVLADPTPQERELFATWRYQDNRAVLHNDIRFLPPNRRAWASWNYQREVGEGQDTPISITYDMTRLQGLMTTERYLVTLNPRLEIPRDRVVHEVLFDHPVYTHQSVATQAPIAALNGMNSTWYCGSYLGFGFHEDAARSAAAVARGFGIDLV